jgi:hypothetical protein
MPVPLHLYYGFAAPVCGLRLVDLYLRLVDLYLRPVACDPAPWLCPCAL